MTEEQYMEQYDVTIMRCFYGKFERKAFLLK